LLRKRLAGNAAVQLHQQSVLDMSLDRKADVVFSVGLVEHFDASGTRQAVLAHFDVLRPGGTLILTFPRPTPLYRVTRRLIEMLGMWKFHDERPLEPAEVLEAVRGRGEVVYQKTLWPLILTQHLIVARKRA
jgi:SAM-dependent methyltransferase